MSTQIEANFMLWDVVTYSLESSRSPETNMGYGTRGPGQPTTRVKWVQKMTPEDDPKALLNTFECTATTARWTKGQ